MVWGKKKNKGYSYFGANVTLEGRLCFSDSIDLVGRINGDVVSDGTLLVMDTAVITGNILVENLILSGTVYGNIKAFKHVQLNASSKVYGHISYGELSLEGAHHEGSSHKLTEEEIENARQECRAILEESAGNAARSLPNEAALEQFSSSVVVSAEKQTSVLLGKKPEAAAPAKKHHAHHHGKSSHGGKHQAPAAGPRKSEAPAAGETVKKPEASGGKTNGEAPRKAEGAAAQVKASGNGEAVKRPEAPGGNSEAAKSEGQKNWDSIKKPAAPPKAPGAKNEATPAKEATPPLSVPSKTVAAEAKEEQPG